MRILLDEDSMQKDLVEALRKRGLDVITVSEAGIDGHTDESVLDFAYAEGRVLYTANVSDFCRLHLQVIAGGQHHAGIVCVPQQRYSVGEQVRRLRDLIGNVELRQMRDRVEFLSAWG